MIDFIKKPVRWQYGIPEFNKVIEYFSKDTSYEMTVYPLFNGLGMLIENDKKRFSVISHYGSYGHESGLLELAEIVDGDILDEPVGWLTTDEVIEIIKGERK